MTTGAKIFIGVLVAGAAAGAGYYFLVVRKRATLDQYEEFGKAVGRLFMVGKPPIFVKRAKKMWVENLTNKDADRLIELAKKDFNSDPEKGIEFDEESGKLISKWDVNMIANENG
jgi:hypothetical protein